MEADFSQFDHLTDVFGNMPFIKRYSLITLAFALPNMTSNEDVVSSLEASLDRLYKAMPWLAGKVIYTGRDETHSGIRKIVPHEGRIPLTVKDLRPEGFPSLEDMAASGFPMLMLDPDKLVPPIAITWLTDGYDKLAPVLILQANIITGGMLLTIASNHSTMDMTGLGMVIAHLAKACRNEIFSEKEIREANADRRNVVPLLEENYRPGNELDDSLIKPNAPQISLPPAQWYYFSFTPSALAALKAAASQQNIVPYISTDDAISALFWQRTSVVRSQLYPDKWPNTSLLARTVSARSYLGLDGYLGHMVDCVYSRLENITTMPLGDIAGKLRALVLDKDAIVRHTRAYLTVLDRMDDKSQIISGAQLNLNWDCVVSSYGNLKTCDLDFGPNLGGRPVAARRARMAGGPGCCYIMPADRSGVVAAAVCLSEEEIEAFKQDEVLKKYASYVG